MKSTANLLWGGLLAAAVAAGLLIGPGRAPAQTGGADLLRNNAKITKLFRPVVAGPSESTVRVVCDGKAVALGAVVGADGWVITKASELSGPVVCRLKDGKEYPAKVVGVHEPYDLALLKIDASGLVPVVWAEAGDAKVGRWVASVGTTEDPIAIGVISVATRKYKADDQPQKSPPPNAGYLGVATVDADGGAKVVQVAKGSAADKAGLKLNDVVTHFGSKMVPDKEALVNLIQKHKVGDIISLKVKRGDEEVEVTAMLEKRPADPKGNVHELQEKMGSALSKRRGGFPSILQHDTVIKPADCGGPLVDLDGKAVGINIARAGRTESYAVPSDVVRDLLPQLMSGQLAPPSEGSDEAAPPDRRTERGSDRK
jgi:serine protease Do